VKVLYAVETVDGGPVHGKANLYRTQGSTTNQQKNSKIKKLVFLRHPSSFQMRTQKRKELAEGRKKRGSLAAEGRIHRPQSKQKSRHPGRCKKRKVAPKRGKTESGIEGHKKEGKKVP